MSKKEKLVWDVRALMLLENVVGDQRTHDFSVSTSLKDGISPTRSSGVVSCMLNVGTVYEPLIILQNKQVASLPRG